MFAGKSGYRWTPETTGKEGGLPRKKVPPDLCPAGSEAAVPAIERGTAAQVQSDTKARTTGQYISDSEQLVLVQHRC